MLIEKQTNLKRIQKLMGHENIETTLNVYGHFLNDDHNTKVIDKSACSVVYFRILVANLWHEQAKYRRKQPFYMHGVQGVASSNLVGPDHNQNNHLAYTYGKKTALRGRFCHNLPVL